MEAAVKKALIVLVLAVVVIHVFHIRVPLPHPLGGVGMGSFQSCVIQRESGGNAQVMNSSGHYGLYQFSRETWIESGGNPADFGNASAAEQNQVFQQAFARFGTAPWAPYDGC